MFHPSISVGRKKKKSKNDTGKEKYVCVFVCLSAGVEDQGA